MLAISASSPEGPQVRAFSGSLQHVPESDNQTQEQGLTGADTDPHAPPVTHQVSEAAGVCASPTAQGCCLGARNHTSLYGANRPWH